MFCSMPKVQDLPANPNIVSNVLSVKSLPDGEIFSSVIALLLNKEEYVGVSATLLTSVLHISISLADDKKTRTLRGLYSVLSTSSCYSQPPCVDSSWIFFFTDNLQNLNKKFGKTADPFECERFQKTPFRL